MLLHWHPTAVRTMPLVAEAPDDDGDATYVESGTVGHKDLYGYQDLSQHARRDHGGAGRHRRPQGRCRQPQPARGAEVGAATAAALRACSAPPTRSTTTGSRSIRRPGRRGPRLASTRCRLAWRWWRDGRAGQPGCGRGTAAGRPKARLSQQSAEMLLQAAPRARLGQQAVEVLRSFTNTTVASPPPAGAIPLHRGVSGSAIAKGVATAAPHHQAAHVRHRRL